MKRPVRTLLALALPAAGLILAAVLCVARVPEGAIGVAGAGISRRVLSPGLHVVSPFDGVDVYPMTPESLARRATLLTSEGARIPIDYRLTVAVDPSRAEHLPARAHAGEPGPAFAEDIASLVEGILAAPAAGGAEPPDPSSRLGDALSSRGLTVMDLTLTPATEATAPAGPGDAVPAAARLDHPIVLIGLDGADWQIIDPLIAKGRLPNIAALASRSKRGSMRSFEPILSPLLWTTVATGKSPDEHGIIDFLLPDPATGRRLPITSRARKVEALWNIFSERGLTSDVIAWWASWPAERIRGRIVSDRVAYSLFDVAQAGEGLTWPAALMDEIRPDLVDDSAIRYEDLSRFLDISRSDFDAARARVGRDPSLATHDPITHLARILASTRTYHRIALRLLDDGQPDLFAVYYQGIDEVSHRFAHFMPPKMAMVNERDFERYHRAVEAFYIYQDELLGQLLAKISPRSTIVVLSDHGFMSGSERPTDGPADIEGKPGKWHRLYGIVMVAGEGIAPGRFDTATLYDITPTVLSLAGLPLAEDMRGKPLLRRSGRAGTVTARVPTYEQTRAAASAAEGAAAEPSAADEELLRNLASLGYISASEVAPREASLRAPSAGTVTSHTNMAALLMQKGDLGGAESEVRQALALRPAWFPALMTLGQILVRQGRVDEALDATRRAVAGSDDAEQSAYVQLALLAARAGERPQAINFLHALEAKRPKADGIETALGVLAMDAGSPQEAEAHYRAALALDPTSTDAMGRLFTLYRGRGREADLQGSILAALAVNERSVMHHNWLGLILMQRGDAAGAEREFRRALALAPDFGGTMANLGSLYGRTGRLDEAVTVLRRALRIEPRNLEAQVNLGAALAKLGRLDEAIESLEAARRMGMESVDLLNAVGLAYAQSGRKQEAIGALGKSLTLSPDQPQVRALLSELKKPS